MITGGGSRKVWLGSVVVGRKKRRHCNAFRPEDKRDAVLAYSAEATCPLVGIRGAACQCPHPYPHCHPNLRPHTLILAPLSPSFSRSPRPFHSHPRSPSHLHSQRHLHPHPGLPILAFSRRGRHMSRVPQASLAPCCEFELRASCTEVLDESRHKPARQHAVAQ